MQVCIKIFWAGLVLFTASNAIAQTSLFRNPADTTAISSAKVQPVAQNPTQRIVALNAAALYAMHSGDNATFDSPRGNTYLLTYDRTEASYGGGSVWVGHVRGHGNDYPVLISTYAGQVNGSIATPNGKLRLEGTEDQSLLTDMAAANERVLVPSMDDVVPALRTSGRSATSSTAPGTSEDIITAASSATSGSPAQIDLLILFTTQLQTQLGGYSQTIARLNLLVATANNAYANSGIYVSLNLIYAQAVNYAYSTSDDNTALSSMQSDPNVIALRNQYGADVVAMVRPFQASICGLSYITADFSNPNYAFSVVEDGANGGYYCDITTLTHEVGHVMGAAHDVAASVQYGGSVDGYPAYNRGYCNGGAGTIMSYTIAANGCSPLAPYFSNPNLNSCGSASCGVPIGTPYTVGSTTVSGADSTTAINANAPLMAAWRSAPSKFTPLVPSRVLDTRAGASTTDGLFAGLGALQPNGQMDLTVAGRGGIPAIGAGAAVLNVTAVNPTTIGFITAWPTGTIRPLASNINFTPGLTVPNLVVAKVGSGGKVSLYNSAGTTDLVADVAGWFPATSAFSPLVPSRILDTRTGSPVPPATELDVVVTGRGGVPASGVGAVVFNLTATQPSINGFITAWPAGSQQPNTSNLNFLAGQTVANLVISRVGTNGSVALYNSNGYTHLIADVAGWFPTTSELTSLVPARLVDTRPGWSTIDGQYAGGGAIGPGGELDFTVTGRAGIPISGVGAVALNVTAVAPTLPGFLTVWPTGNPRPNASNLNFKAGKVVQNFVIAKVSTNGQVAIYNSTGSTQVIADVVGWFSTP